MITNNDISLEVTSGARTDIGRPCPPKVRFQHGNSAQKYGSENIRSPKIGNVITES